MSSKKFTEQTFAWLRLLKGDRDRTALAVGMQLVEHFNEKHEGGCAWPGTGSMAKELGLSESTVVRAVHRMHARGRLRVEWGTRGRGHSNRYWMIVKKDAPAQVLDTGKDAPPQVLDPPKPAPASAVKPAPAPRKPAAAHMNHLKNQVEEANASSTGGNEREHSLADPGALAEGGAREDFEVLASLWHEGRGWPYTDKHEAADRRAYTIARRNASRDEIMAAAHAWAAAVEPDKRPKLADWLSRDNWRKSPPQKATRKSREPTMGDAFLNSRYRGGS